MKRNASIVEQELELCAYETHDPRGMPIRPAPLERKWMDATRDRFAYRCLPMVIANQSGWVIENPADFRLRWNGGEDPSDLEIEYGSEIPDRRVMSHFGHGILTFAIPYLFRSPTGINLWVKGPSNYWKDGMQALEGVVEADWAVASFTMNWKVTRPDHEIHFQAGEPICMLVPQQRELAESLTPIRKPLERAPSLQAQFERWKASRDTFNAALADADRDAVRRGWQKDYTLGLDMRGQRHEVHQLKVNLKAFEPCEEE